MVRGNERGDHETQQLDGEDDMSHAAHIDFASRRRGGIVALAPGIPKSALQPAGGLRQLPDAGPAIIKGEVGNIGTR